MPVSEWLRWFSFKQTSAEQDVACIRIRTAVGQLAETYLGESEPGAEQVATMRLLKAAQAAMLSHVVNPMPSNAFRG